MKKIFLIFFGVVFSFFLFFIVDRIFGFFLPTSKMVDEPFFPPKAKSPYGYYPEHKSDPRQKMNERGEVIYDVVYNYDNFRRRVVPQSKAEKKKVALFFGDSMVFGEGLNDEQTIPSVFAKKKNDLQVYNYAFMGYGPQQMLVKLRRGFEKEEILNSGGLAFFVYFDYLLSRIAMTSQVISWSGGAHPYFTLDSDGELINRGPYSVVRPIYNFILWHLSRSHLFTYFNVNFPLPGKEHVEIACSILKESTALLRKKNIDLVIFSPLKKVKINSCPEGDLRIIIFDGKVDDINKLFIPGDGHFNAEAAKLFGEWLAEQVPSLLSPQD